MSTIKSSAENLTLNADGANNDIKFQSNGSEVASIDQAGVMTATSYAGSGANLTGLPASGLPLTGGTMTGDVIFNDNVKALIGTGSDVQIYFDGNKLYVKNGGTHTRLYQTYFEVNNAAGTESMLSASADGAVELRYNGNAKFHTTDTGVKVTGGIAIGGTGTANTLDDYEEGTWTPVNNGTAFATAYGSYTKIGNRVFCQWKVTAGGGNTAGDWSGLPFTIRNSSILGVGGGSVSYNLIDSNLAWNVSCENVNTTQWSLRAGNTQKQLTSNSGACWGSMSYLV